MLIAPERFASRRDTLTFVACILLSIAARVAPAPIQETIASSISNTILAPFLALQHQVEFLRTYSTSFAEIRAERDSAAIAALELVAIQEQNDKLRQLLSLSSRLPVGHVSAEVLHQPSPLDEYAVVLTAGRNRGVTRLAPVVSPDGLVGVISSVQARTSSALVWSHPDFRASAMTADGTVFGIVQPRGSDGPSTPLMELRGVPIRDHVPPGTRIFTSGAGTELGGVYPRGIPIGTVIAVGEERAGWSRTYVIRPAVHPASVGHVIILLGDIENAARSFGANVP